MGGGEGAQGFPLLVVWVQATVPLVEVVSTKQDEIGKALLDTLISPNESDRNWEAANVVDGLFFIGRAILKLSDSIDALNAKGKP